jgi:hypothetical protein
MVTLSVSSVEPVPAVTAEDLIAAARAAGCQAHHIARAHGRVEEMKRDRSESMVGDSMYDFTIDVYEATRPILLDGASEAVRAAVLALDAEHRAEMERTYGPPPGEADPFAVRVPS